jgi:hypothetical protein
MASDVHEHTQHNELLFPPVLLKRSPQSETNQVLYSADVGSRFGRGARLGIYVQPEAVPSPVPEQIAVMVYRRHPGRKEGRRVYRLLWKSDHPCNAVRYDKPKYRPCDVHTVFFPERMFSGSAPEELYVELNFAVAQELDVSDGPADPVSVVVSKGAKYWFGLSHQAKVEGLCDGYDRRLLYHIGMAIRKGEPISMEQARTALSAMESVQPP